MYWTLLVAILCTFILSYPPTDYVVRTAHGAIAFHLEMGFGGFVVTIFVLGFFMALGKAAVYKHIPVYYPKNVGAVGGLVGMIGGLGGFVLPIAFGALFDLTGTVDQLLHAAVPGRRRRARLDAFLDPPHGAGRCRRRAEALPQLPEMQAIHRPEHIGALSGAVLQDWRPDDKAFWETTGRAIARKNLWMSIPSLFLSFAIWQVWSVVVAKLPLVGFKYSTDQLFWLAALPGLTGATLRIFYSFMVPIFGGRLWTTLATWSLMIPAIGIGYAVQNPDTPYIVLLILALLCGFGGGNFASSMANISFFFPKAEKGNALALNAGPRQSRRQRRAVPCSARDHRRACSAGSAARPDDRGRRQRTLWLQNAGFVWVPFIAVSAFAAWFGMNDIASAKASFAEQAVIFSRRHNWIMCCALYRHLRLLHRLFGGLPAADQDPVPAGRCAAIRLPRPAGRRAGALGNRLDRRPLGRRARHARGLRAA